VILVDTSAWIEFLRGTESATCREVDRLLGTEIAVTDPVLMEVLAGARDDKHLRDLRGLVVVDVAERLPCTVAGHERRFAPVRPTDCSVPRMGAKMLGRIGGWRGGEGHGDRRGPTTP
jgi:predicted nucleic acid-binding protein